MKKLIFPLVLFLTFFKLHAQVILNDSLWPEPGTYIYMRIVDDAASMHFTHSGEDVNWDFTSLVSSDQDTVAYLDPSTTPFFGSFTQSNLALSMSAMGIAYLQNDESASQLLGINGDPGTGTALTIPLDPILTLFQFPYSFGDSILSTARASIRGTGTMFGQPALDSVKLVSTIITHRKVMAWGLMLLPCGDFPETLLEKGIITRIDSAWTKVPFFGWIPVPGFPMITVDTMYNWFTANSIHPYAQLVVDQSGTPYSASYYSGNLEAIDEYSHSQNFPFVVSPNPIESEVSLFSTQGDWSGKLFDYTGRLLRDNIKLRVGTTRVDLSWLETGVYLLVLKNSKGEVKTIKIQKR